MGKVGWAWNACGDQDIDLTFVLRRQGDEAGVVEAVQADVRILKRTRSHKKFGKLSG